MTPLDYGYYNPKNITLNNIQISPTSTFSLASGVCMQYVFSQPMLIQAENIFEIIFIEPLDSGTTGLANIGYALGWKIEVPSVLPPQTSWIEGAINPSKGNVLTGLSQLECTIIPTLYDHTKYDSGTTIGYEVQFFSQQVSQKNNSDSPVGVRIVLDSPVYFQTLTVVETLTITVCLSNIAALVGTALTAVGVAMAFVEAQHWKTKRPPTEKNIAIELDENELVAPNTARLTSQQEVPINNEDIPKEEPKEGEATD